MTIDESPPEGDDHFKARAAARRYWFDCRRNLSVGSIDILLKNNVETPTTDYARGWFAELQELCRSATQEEK